MSSYYFRAAKLFHITEDLLQILAVANDEFTFLGFIKNFHNLGMEKWRPLPDDWATVLWVKQASDRKTELIKQCRYNLKLLGDRLVGGDVDAVIVPMWTDLRVLQLLFSTHDTQVYFSPVFCLMEPLVPTKPEGGKSGPDGC